MYPHYEKTIGYLIIEWYEKRKNASPVHHYYSQIPTYLQLHPKDPKKIVRATFADKIPPWMEKYAKEHDFCCQQVTRSGEVCWWMANWTIYPDGHKPLTSPHLDGSFEQFTSLIPDVCGDLKEKVLAYRETIKMNLRNYPDGYLEFGLYFRPEEINRIGGALLIADFVPTRIGGESDDDYRFRIERDGRLERLVFELITPLPEPMREEMGITLDEPNDEMDLSDIEFADDEEEEVLFENIEFEDVPTESEDILTDGITLDDTTQFDDKKIEGQPESAAENSSIEPEEFIPTLDETTAVNHPTEDISQVTSIKIPEKSLYSGNELKVTDIVGKKVVEGQFSLF